MYIFILKVNSCSQQVCSNFTHPIKWKVTHSSMFVRNSN